MKVLPQKRIRWLATALMPLFAAAGLLAQEQQFADFNCALTPPDTWQVTTNLPPKRGVLAQYCNAAKTRLIVLPVQVYAPSGSAAFQFGQKMGYLTAMLATVFAVVAVTVAVIMWVWRSNRMSQARRASGPPPLPPSTPPPLPPNHC
jgi:hypothetical protein